MTYIIAEAGVNHNGDIALAKKLIETAKNAGADAIKFQTFIPSNLVSSTAEKAAYQKETTGKNESQKEMIQKLSLSFDDFRELAAYCKSIRIAFASTPFDLESIHFLDTIDMPFWKIPSGEITNLPYLIEIGKTKKPVIMSTGMSSLQEIQVAIDVLKKNGSTEITLLHCNTAYPTPFKDVNLKAMETMKNAFSLPVGYSDHTQGIEVPIAAVALGAVVIEKHFTLDRNMEGPDHKASLEPSELKAMVSSIRNIEKALRNGDKTPTASEIVNRDVVRKSIVAKRDIKAGELYTEENITVKRPGNGISPMKWFEILGKKAPRNFKYDELIEL